MFLSCGTTFSPIWPLRRAHRRYFHPPCVFRLFCALSLTHLDRRANPATRRNGAINSAWHACLSLSRPYVNSLFSLSLSLCCILWVLIHNDKSLFGSSRVSCMRVNASCVVVIIVVSGVVGFVVVVVVAVVAVVVVMMLLSPPFSCGRDS